MRVSSLTLRRVHKWIGLIIGIQLILWTLSGAVMSTLDHETVAGGPAATPEPPALPDRSAWPDVARRLGGGDVVRVALRPFLDGHVYEVWTSDGPKLFDVASGEPVSIDAALAQRVAIAGHGGAPRVRSVTPLAELELAVREHELPIWRIDFDDEGNSSFYVSGVDGRLLERRNDTWRTWDFFWMLHNMDYSARTSFNHPLIVLVGFAALWLAITGFWLLFRTAWRPDFRVLLRRFSKF